MTEKPILFKGDMVTAIRDDRKTHTRRLNGLETINRHPDIWSFVGFRRDLGYPASQGFLWAGFLYGDNSPVYIKCPFGDVNEGLWVRETFTGCDLPGYGDIPCIVYDDEWENDEYNPREARPWARKFGRIPSIHMPRDASRINLEIVDIRVERVQDITELDARAEGCSYDDCNHIDPDGFTAKNRFETLWDSINKKRGFGWDENVWVWVVEFKRI